ncbi:MAG: PKD domain-containing protein, partial [Thermoplasmata archaeon]|nr:PKD domain-containing protein [Thermoplasmata archaeon]
TDWTNDSTVEHKWKYSGTYTITLTVRDNSGLSNETQMQIKVVGEESGGISTETMNTIIAGVIITVIIIVVVVIVIIVIKRSQEAI